MDFDEIKYIHNNGYFLTFFIFANLNYYNGISFMGIFSESIPRTLRYFG